MKKVLITGASGLIGTSLTTMLLTKGYDVNVLARGGKVEGSYRGADNRHCRSFSWNIEVGEMDRTSLEGVSAIIHLAGAGIADTRWTDERKKEIIDSRVKSAKLIFDYLESGNHIVKTFISASAVGYYGDCGNELVTEERQPGNDFLAEVCRQWEIGAMHFSEIGIREVRCRIGVILAKSGGALTELTRTIPFGIAGYFAKNNLYFPWIYIDDMCGIICYALENERISGAYNTTAPGTIPIKDFIKEVIVARKSKSVLIPVPPFAIKLALGEMADMALSSQKCSAEKIQSAGYKFIYPGIQEALKEIYG